MAQAGQWRASDADKRAARRLFACAGVAVLAGAVSMVALPPQAMPAKAAKVQQTVAAAQQARPPQNPAASATSDMALPEDAPLPAEAAVAPEAYEAATPSGLSVVAFFPPMPLTVRERARLRLDASTDAEVLETLEPGRPLRVVGAVDVPSTRGGPWLQVRTSRGALAYVQSALAADLQRWRQAQVAERLRRQEEAAAAAAKASGIDVQPGVLPPDLMTGTPVTPPPPPEPTP